MPSFGNRPIAPPQRNECEDVVGLKGCGCGLVGGLWGGCGVFDADPLACVWAVFAGESADEGAYEHAGWHTVGEAGDGVGVDTGFDDDPVVAVSAWPVRVGPYTGGL